MDTNEENSISEKQVRFARAMIFRGDNQREIFNECDVSEEEFEEWIADPVFREYVTTLARDYAEADEVSVWRALLGQIRSGSVPAIRLYFDLKGKRTAETKGIRDTEIDALRRDIFGGE